VAGAFIKNDLASLFDPRVFAENDGDATFNGTVVMGIFDDEDKEVQLSDGVGEIVPMPTFTGRESDFSGVADGDSMVIRNEMFKVKNWKRDGAGMIEIFLERT
jgi:hypothetical protein